VRKERVLARAGKSHGWWCHVVAPGRGSQAGLGALVLLWVPAGQVWWAVLAGRAFVPSAKGASGVSRNSHQAWPSGETASVVVRCRDFLTLERVAQRGGRCPVSRNIQGQPGRGSEQPDPVEDVSAHCRGVGLDDL